jgi:hypothetical protein
MPHVPGFVRVAASLAVATFLAVGPAVAAPVTLARTEVRTDYVSAGIAGIGNGPGTLVVSGVDGPVRKAFLYWQGVDLSGTGAVYDNETISFAGSNVTGISLGDSETNCWGAGSSRAFFADVTPLVTGNGSYVIDGLDAKTGHNGNGASLIVLFNDADPDNDSDLVFFEGNDSDIVQGFPGETPGWSATLANIQYGGGTVLAQMHASDGQSFGDGPVTFTGESTVTIQDTESLWDGNSVPNAGFSRAGTDGLWDIHTFDITNAFGEPGSQTISLSGMLSTGDCHSLIALVLDLEGGSAPCGNGVLDEGEECDFAGSGQVADCPGVQSCIADCSCGCTNDFQCNDGIGCTTDSCNVELGRCDHEPACASGPGCEDTCDQQTGACRLCGHPFRNDRCVVNAVVVLQASLELRDCELCTCDVNSSQSVTATDALMILRGCAGLPSELQCTIPESTTTAIGIQEAP